MEEDIKIIEELIEPFREQNRKGKKLILDIKGIKYEHYEAIENLIARYKELEEENIHWKGKYHLLSRKIDVIQKSKVKEKIEELRKKEEEIYKLNYQLESEKAIDCILLRIADLQELLED